MEDNTGDLGFKDIVPLPLTRNLCNLVRTYEARMGGRSWIFFLDFPSYPTIIGQISLSDDLFPSPFSLLCQSFSGI